jgi:ankyrin repeat protein
MANSLISAGASLEEKDDDQMTALICAAQEGHTDITKSLIAAGASLDVEDRKSRTALILAAE